MSYVPWRIVIGLTAGWLAIASTIRAADDSGIIAAPDRSFYHKDSKTLLKVPADWTIIPPYRLRRTTSSTVLGFEKDKPPVSVTMVWSPIGKQPFSDIIRAAAEENLGDEYATLVTVYGKAKVGRPTTIKVGPYTVYKILVEDGPEKGLYGGAVYLFEAGSGDNRWKVKIRADFPLLNRDIYIKQVEELVGQFSQQE